MSDIPTTVKMQLCIEDVMRGRIPLFDGVEKLLGLAKDVPTLEHNRDRRKLAELLAMADHLPIGAAREHWQAEALHRADRELMELERQHKDAVFYACRRLLTALEG